MLAGRGTSEFRAALTKVLQSREFASSRQLRQFLSYVGEKAIEGRDHLDQAEIAANALGRAENFNPLDDTSVRRTASELRQRLAAYYAGEGSGDQIRISLPVRSYVPVFEPLESVRSSIEKSGAEGAQRQPRGRVMASRMLVLPAAGLVLALAFGTFLAWRSSRADAASPMLERRIRTSHGDILNSAADVSPENLLLGPEVATSDEVVARMRFTPEMAYQQAGIMVYESPDSYVKLARHFTTRVEWEFGLETAGRYHKPPGTWTYDPLGQDGEPVWVAIRRRAEQFEAFVSQDGTNWRKVGNTLRKEGEMRRPRAAIFAFNGQANANSVEAVFSHLSVGLTVPDWPQQLKGNDTGGWRQITSCGDGTGPRLEAPVLTFRFNDTRQSCNWWLLRPAPAGDWALSTRIDFLAFSGTTAGIAVRGPKGRMRLIRWAVNGAVLSAEFPPGNKTVSVPDYPGSPPVTLLIENRGGTLRASYSRDQRHFVALPVQLSVDLLGQPLQYGVTAQLTTWNDFQTLPEASFLSIRREALSLTPYR